MKNYKVISFITINEHDLTKNNIKDIMRNALLHQYIFVDKSLKPIEINIDTLFNRFQQNNSDVWCLHARQANVKLQLNADSLILTSMEEQKQDFGLIHYIEIMLSLCENILIWNFEAKEI